MLKQFTLAFLLVIFPLPAFAWEARVVSVADGDTITVEPLEGGDRVKIRLWGIDCPETNQPYGQAAKVFVNELCLFKVVDIEDKDIDRYKRLVATVNLADGTTLQERLLASGLAWVYKRYCVGCYPWIQLEVEARNKHIGLWKDKNPTPPWKWRKKKR